MDNNFLRLALLQPTVRQPDNTLQMDYLPGGQQATVTTTPVMPIDIDMRPMIQQQPMEKIDLTAQGYRPVYGLSSPIEPGKIMGWELPSEEKSGQANNAMALPPQQVIPATHQEQVLRFQPPVDWSMQNQRQDMVQQPLLSVSAVYPEQQNRQREQAMVLPPEPIMPTPVGTSNAQVPSWQQQQGVMQKIENEIRAIGLGYGNHPVSSPDFYRSVSSAIERARRGDYQQIEQDDEMEQRMREAIDRIGTGGSPQDKALMESRLRGYQLARYAALVQDQSIDPAMLPQTSQLVARIRDGLAAYEQGGALTPEVAAYYHVVEGVPDPYEAELERRVQAYRQMLPQLSDTVLMAQVPEYRLAVTELAEQRMRKEAIRGLVNRMGLGEDRRDVSVSPQAGSVQLPPEETGYSTVVERGGTIHSADATGTLKPRAMPVIDGFGGVIGGPFLASADGGGGVVVHQSNDFDSVANDVISEIQRQPFVMVPEYRQDASGRMAGYKAAHDYYRRLSESITTSVYPTQDSSTILPIASDDQARYVMYINTDFRRQLADGFLSGQTNPTHVLGVAYYDKGEITNSIIPLPFTSEEKIPTNIASVVGAQAREILRQVQYDTVPEERATFVPNYQELLNVAEKNGVGSADFQLAVIEQFNDAMSNLGYLPYLSASDIYRVVQDVTEAVRTMQSTAVSNREGLDIDLGQLKKIRGETGAAVQRQSVQGSSGTYEIPTSFSIPLRSNNLKEIGRAFESVLPVVDDVALGKYLLSRGYPILGPLLYYRSGQIPFVNAEEVSAAVEATREFGRIVHRPIEFASERLQVMKEAKPSIQRSESMSAQVGGAGRQQKEGKIYTSGQTPGRAETFYYTQGSTPGHIMRTSVKKDDLSRLINIVAEEAKKQNTYILPKEGGLSTVFNPSSIDRRDDIKLYGQFYHRFVHNLLNKLQAMPVPTTADEKSKLSEIVNIAANNGVISSETKNRLDDENNKNSIAMGSIVELFKSIWNSQKIGPDTRKKILAYLDAVLPAENVANAFMEALGISGNYRFSESSNRQISNILAQNRDWKVYLTEGNPGHVDVVNEKGQRVGMTSADMVARRIIGSSLLQVMIDNMPTILDIVRRSRD